MRDPFTLPEERMLFRFASEADLAIWDKFQDSDVGGKSTVSLNPSLDDPVRAHMPALCERMQDMLSYFLCS